MNNKAFFQRSVITKYSLGYILLSIIAVGLLLTSFCSNWYLSSQYEKTIGELLDLNQLYIDIESVNNSVNMGYLYLREEGYEAYQEACVRADDSIRQVTENVSRNYSREITDMVCTTETYLEQANELMGMIRDYIRSDDKKNADFEKIGRDYEKTQETLSYISLSFQTTYSTQLVSTQTRQQEIKTLQSEILLFQTVFALSGCLLCVWYCMKFLKGITHSIGKLTAAVQKIEEDVYQENHVEIESRDEFGEFAGVLNHMLDVIQNQMRKIQENADVKERLAEAEIENLRIYGELQKSQLTLLQSRINPHFLFNTLNMISSMARIEEADKSAELMEITAAYLRYNLDNLTKTVTLQKEIDNIRNYIKIQQCRFDNRFSFDISVGEECLDFQMPYLILQPLVENAIKHGVAMMKRGGKIWIESEKSGSRVMMAVMDNGAGLSQEEIEELNSRLKDDLDSGGHMGLKNIYKRLQYFYEGDVSFEISREEGITRIAVSLPC